MDCRYFYRVKLVKVVDGDTVDLLVDLGFYLTMERRFRLIGINAPEKNSTLLTERQAAAASAAALEGFISDASHTGRLRVRTERDLGDKYGRYLATLLVQQDDGTLFDVNEAMRAGGYAVRYS